MSVPVDSGCDSGQRSDRFSSALRAVLIRSAFQGLKPLATIEGHPGEEGRGSLLCNVVRGAWGFFTWVRGAHRTFWAAAGGTACGTLVVDGVVADGG